MPCDKTPRSCASGANAQALRFSRLDFPMSEPQICYFYKIPAELRVIIYTDVLEEYAPSFKLVRPALIDTCRFIRNDARGCYRARLEVLKKQIIAQMTLAQRSISRDLRLIMIRGWERDEKEAGQIREFDRKMGEARSVSLFLGGEMRKLKMDA